MSKPKQPTASSSSATQPAQDSAPRAEEIRAQIAQRLAESGERERLKDLLRSKLVESGWRDAMKAYCREIIKQRGADSITAEDLVQEITPKGREEVPAAVKQEALQRIRKFLSTMNEPKS